MIQFFQQRLGLLQVFRITSASDAGLPTSDSGLLREFVELDGPFS